MDWHIDWLTVTVWGDDIVRDFDLFFDGILGDLRELGYGGRFYKETYRTEPGIIVRDKPINDIEKRSTIEIPGVACQMLGFDLLRKFLYFLVNGYERVKVNRIDVAYDNMNFSVDDVWDCLQDDEVRSYFKRSTMEYRTKPKQKKDNGELGTHAVTMGGRSSNRYMRVYDKHGFVRLEIEYKDVKADQVARDILLWSGSEVEALKISMGHLADYVEFFKDWWVEFMSDFERLYANIPGDIKIYTMGKLKDWMKRQVSAAYYVLSMLDDDESMRKEILEEGRKKYKKSKYVGLVENFAS